MDIDSATPLRPGKHSPFDPTKWAVIVDSLLSFCGYEQLLRLRGASHAYHELCDARLARHTIITPAQTKKGEFALVFTTPAASQVSQHYNIPLLPVRNSTALLPAVKRMLAKARVVDAHYAASYRRTSWTPPRKLVKRETTLSTRLTPCTSVSPAP